MSDWKKRAEPVADAPDWKSRAEPVDAAPEQPSTVAKALEWYARQPKVNGIPIPLGEGDTLTKLASFTNGVTQGLAPAIGAASDVVGAAASGAIPEHPGDEFMARREALRRYYTGAEVEEPALSLAGGMLTPLPGAKARAAAGVGGIAARVGSAALLGALNAEERAPQSQAMDSGEHGAEFGGGLALAAEALPLVGRATPWLQRVAAKNAVTAMAPGGQIGDKLKSRGYTEGADALALGRSMLDEGLVPWFGSPTSINERANALRQQMGAQAGQAIDAAGTTGAMPDQARAAWGGLNKMGGPLGPNAQEIAASGKGMALVQGMADEAERGLPPPEAWREMNRYKSQAWDSANFKDDAPLVAQQYRKAVSGMRDSIAEQVGEVAGPKVGEQLREANRRFGTAADVADMSADRVRRDFFTKGNAATAIMGAGAAASMAAIGAAPMAAMVAASVPILGKTLASPANLARSADAASRFTSALPQQSIGSPAATSTAARKLWEWYGVAPKDEQDISKQYADQELPGL